MVPSPGGLPNPGIEPRSPALRILYHLGHQGSLITGDWNAKEGSQETPGVTGKFGLGMWKEAGQRLIELC